MKKSIPVPVVIGVVVVVLVIALGFGFASMNGNGEGKNPDVGKPKPSVARKMSFTQAQNMDKDTYVRMLKQNRPDLSEAEIQAKADNWWRIKTGEAGK